MSAHREEWSASCPPSLRDIMSQSELTTKIFRFLNSWYSDPHCICTLKNMLTHILAELKASPQQEPVQPAKLFGLSQVRDGGSSKQAGTIYNVSITQTKKTKKIATIFCRNIS